MGGGACLPQADMGCFDCECCSSLDVFSAFVGPECSPSVPGGPGRSWGGEIQEGRGPRPSQPGPCQAGPHPEPVPAWAQALVGDGGALGPGPQGEGESRGTQGWGRGWPGPGCGWGRGAHARGSDGGSQGPGPGGEEPDWASNGAIPEQQVSRRCHIWQFQGPMRNQK